MDNVATLRPAGSSPASAFWWLRHSVRVTLVVGCALHYMSHWQTFSIRNVLPQPDWVEEALLGTRQGAETAPLGQEAGRPNDPRWETWDSAKAKVVHHACLPSMLIKIVHDGFSRVVGPGAWAMKEGFGALWPVYNALTA